MLSTPHLVPGVVRGATAALWGSRLPLSAPTLRSVLVVVFKTDSLLVFISYDHIHSSHG